LSRSSIFSFDTLELRRPGAAFWWFVAFVLLARVGVWLGHDALRGIELMEHRQLELLIDDVKDHTVDGRAVDVRVAVFGSSRTRIGFSRATWGEMSDVHEAQVVNYSVDSGTASTHRRIIDAMGGLPDTTRLVIIDVEPWMFNASRGLSSPDLIDVDPPADHGAPHATQRRTAPVARRDPTEEPDESFFLSDAAHAVFPIKNYRRPLDEWITVIVRGVTTDDRPNNNRRYTPRELDTRWVERHFKDARWAPERLDTLKELVASISAPNRRIVLFHPPVRRGYLAAINNDPTNRAFFDRFEKEVRGLASPDVEVLFWKSTDECGLSDDLFYDYGHATDKGARALTRRLYEALDRHR